MVTKQQAVSARYGDVFHYIGTHDCTRLVGPRGGVTEKIIRVRVTGKCQVWKTRPEEFRLPVKYGLRESAAITEINAHLWHKEEDCPLP